LVVDTEAGCMLRHTYQLQARSISATGNNTKKANKKKRIETIVHLSPTARPKCAT
jgi:hypothetical protein